jgi:hypothetical protein
MPPESSSSRRFEEGIGHWLSGLVRRIVLRLGLRRRQELPMKTRDYQLADIVSMLSKHHQRATYGAVAGLVGGLARSLMSGQPKSRANSWIVSARTGRPTGYVPGEIDRALESRPEVLSTPEELAAWLREHSGS